MILQNGGNVAVLDLNADLGNKAVSELGPSARFFACDVTDSESVKKAVKGTVAWVRETGRPLGGVVPAAGIANPGTVCRWFSAREEGMEERGYGMGIGTWKGKTGEEADASRSSTARASPSTSRPSTSSWPSTSAA